MFAKLMSFLRLVGNAFYPPREEPIATPKCRGGESIKALVMRFLEGGDLNKRQIVDRILDYTGRTDRVPVDNGVRSVLSLLTRDGTLRKRHEPGRGVVYSLTVNEQAPVTPNYEPPERFVWPV